MTDQPATASSQKSPGRQTVAWLSLGVAVAALGMKYLAWQISGSVALKSDALETVINVIAAACGLWAVRLAERPADENHTYGHYKAEYLSAILESALVLITAAAIGHAAWDGFHHPSPPHATLNGLLLNGAATVLNLVWGLILLRTGRRRRSPALVAGARHVLSDVWTGAGLVAGLSLMPLTGWWWLDPALAALIAVNVLRVGWEMLRESVSGLMDEAPEPETLEKIHKAIAEAATGALEVHDIRVREAGAVTFVEFHLIVPGTMTVNESHVICDRIEAAIRQVTGRALISIHTEPEYKAKNTGLILARA